MNEKEVKLMIAHALAEEHAAIAILIASVVESDSRDDAIRRIREARTAAYQAARPIPQLMLDAALSLLDHVRGSSEAKR